MNNAGTVVIVGGTSEIGKRVGKYYAERNHKVILTCRTQERADAAAQEMGENFAGIALDLSKPEEIAGVLADVDDVARLALVAVHRDENSVKDYKIAGALYLVTLKLVGYTEVIHVLAPRMQKGASIVLFGGLAKERPYPGSTTVTTVNGGVTAMVRTLALELAPIRVNAIHPAVVGDSPYWVNKPPEVLERLRSRTPLGELITMDDVAEATIFLLENRGVTGVNLNIDGGWLLT